MNHRGNRTPPSDATAIAITTGSAISPRNALGNPNRWACHASATVPQLIVALMSQVKLASGSAASLTCDINATISCGTVAEAWQAHLFGFPNAFLGLIAEPVVIAIAVASLGGVRFPRWFMLSAQVVYTLGLVFAYWLFTQSMFVIGALCPWCPLVTVSTTLVFASLTHVNIRDGNLPLPPRLQRWARDTIAADIDAIGTVAWLVLLAAAILAKYGTALFA